MMFDTKNKNYSPYGVTLLKCSRCGFEEHKLTGGYVKKFCTKYCVSCGSDRKFILRYDDEQEY